MKAQPVFVIGPPRSGTTLLQSILSSHSAIATLPETHFFEHVIPKLGYEYFNPNSNFPAEGLSLIDAALQKEGFSLDLKATKYVEGATTKSVFEFIVKTYVPPSALMFVEKTPGHACYIPQIRRFYPNAKFVAVIRHPVESVGSRYMYPKSLNGIRKRRIDSVGMLIKNWKNCCSNILENQDQNVLIVCYEELVKKPEGTLKNICYFLDVNYEHNMLTDFGSTAREFVNINVCPWKSENLSKTIKDNTYKWRKRLPRRKIWLIEEYTEDLLLSLGYTRTVHPGFAEKKIAILEDEICSLIRYTDLEYKLRESFMTCKELIHRLWPF